MTIAGVLANLSVTDLDEAERWYALVLGAPPAAGPLTVCWSGIPSLVVACRCRGTRRGPVGRAASSPPTTSTTSTPSPQR